MNPSQIAPRAHREPVRIEASLTLANSEQITVEVEDISPQGCCVLGDYRIGEFVTIRLPGVEPALAQVRWALLGRAGLRFEREQAH